MDVGNDMGSRIEKVKVEDLVSDVGCHNDSLDVCDDISYRTEKVKVEDPIDLGMIISRVFTWYGLFRETAL